MANVQHNSLTGADLHDAGPVTVDLDLTDQAADPATPASGHHAAYAKAGGLYVKDPAGAVVGPLIDAASSVSLGTPALTLGTTNAAGSGSTAVGTGATIAAFDATVPVTQALGDAAAAGTAAVAARRDHKHGMPALSTATPLVESGSGAAGTGTLSSREDHVHPAGGGSLTVEEADGTPTVTGVTTIKVSNGTLTDDGSGVVSITTGGGGGGAYDGSATLDTIASSGATLTVDIANGATQDITLTANCTITLANPADSTHDWTLTLILRQDATGGRTVTWPGSVLWPNSFAPQLSTAANAVDIIDLVTVDGGTAWYGEYHTGGSQENSGTSFPLSPADGDFFYRTDRNLDYFYSSSVGHWLTKTLYHDQLYTSGVPVTAVNNFYGMPGWNGEYSVYLVEAYIIMEFGSGVSGSNFWTATLYWISSSNPATYTSLGSVNDSADTAGTWYNHVLTIGTVIGTTLRGWRLGLAMTGTPSGTYIGLAATYRLVG